MKDFFRGITVLIFYTSLLIQPKPAEARFSNRAGHQLQERTRPFNESEVAFLAHYVTYLKFTLYLHGIEIKKKIACLGYPELADFYLLEFDEADSINQEARQALSNYIESDDCQTLLDETLPDIMRTFIEMRAQLALHQARDNEVIYKMLHNRGGMMSSGSNYPDFLMCDRIENPIYVRETRLCLENISSIMNIRPNHLLQKSHLIILDDLVRTRDLPEVSELLPLTWPEVMYASQIFQEKYVNNEITDYSLTREETPDFETPWELREFYRENPMEEALQSYGLEYLRYAAAKDYQKPAGLFTDYPEDSAPYKYTQGLAKYPFLAFMTPQRERVDLDCQTDAFVQENPNLSTLCNLYLESLGEEHTYHLRVTRRSVADALIETLNLNYEMIKGIENDYPIENLIAEDGELLDQGRYYDLNSWHALMKMQNLNEHFFSLYPRFTDQEQRFVEIMNRRENLILWGSLAVAVGAGVACGFIGWGWGAAACLIGAGGGLNVALFYAQAYRAYERDFGMYFAIDVTQETEGELLSLIEFGTLESSLQNLYLEKLFLGIGTGIGEVLSRARHLRRLAQ